MSKIPLAGVIGFPVAHSKSPKLHGYWLSKLGISGHYVPLEISTDDLEQSLRMMPKMGFVGANVTIPHKEAALQLADEITERARKIGAANTLVFQEGGKILADNTDGIGFIQNLRQNAPNWKPESGPAAVLGAGGAARAILVSLLDEGVPQIMLSNRTRQRAEDLAQEFGDEITVVDWNDADQILQDAATVVNTTSLGMTGKPPLEISLERLNPQALVTDIVYAPLKTALLEQAEIKGCDIVDGLGMLLHQAVPGFERWFGKRPVVDGETRSVVLS